MMMGNYRKSEAEFLALKKNFLDKKISREEFIGANKKLRVLDNNRDYWMIGMRSGQWYLFKENKWTRQDPYRYWGQSGEPLPGRKDIRKDARPDARSFFLNLAVGVFIAAWALWQQWPASRIIWQFWAFSLLFGLPLSLAGGVMKARTDIDIQDTGKKYFLLVSGAILVGIIMLLPILFFHSLFALFFNHFFPILGWDPMGKHISMIIPFTWEILLACIRMYWVFLLVFLLTKTIDLIRMNRSGGMAIVPNPYTAVVQMHLLIIVFGFFASIGVSSNALYLLLIFSFIQIPQAFAQARAVFSKKGNLNPR